MKGGCEGPGGCEGLWGWKARGAVTARGAVMAHEAVRAQGKEDKGLQSTFGPAAKQSVANQADKITPRIFKALFFRPFPRITTL